MNQAGVATSAARLDSYGNTVATAQSVPSVARQANTPRRNAMKTMNESSVATDSRPDAQVIPFPTWAIRRTPPQAIPYEQTKEYEERMARIRDKIQNINRMLRENHNG
jgi:hypothetical protein